MKKNPQRESVYEKLLLNSKKQLEIVLAGTISRLDWHFYRKMNKSFIEALVEEPREALVNLMEFYGLDSTSDTSYVKFIIYSCLKTLFLNNTQYCEKAYESLMRGNYEEFHELIEKFLMELKKTHTSH